MNKLVLKYLLNNIKKTKNIVFIFINVILIFIILICFTIIKFTNDYDYATKNNIEGRTILVSSNTDLNLLNNEHIIFVSYDKYRFGYSFFYNSDNYIYIKALTDKNYLKIIDGNNLSNSGDMVCSKKLYPYEYSSNMDFSKTIDSKKLIEKNISDGNYNFKVVGTFANIEMEEANICYVSVDDFDKFPIEPYNQIMIIVDDINNYNDVLNYLKNNNVSYIVPVSVDETIIYLKEIPLFIMSIIILIILLISFNFIKKNINNDSMYIGLLKIYGDTNNNIIKYFICNYLIINTISFIISFILYTLLYILIQPYLTELFYYNLYLNIPFMYIFLFIICYTIYVILSIVYLIRKILKKDICDLLIK